MTTLEDFYFGNVSPSEYNQGRDTKKKLSEMAKLFDEFRSIITSEQQNVKLESGGTLRYTVGYMTVGDMECWNGVGITPDVVVEMDEELIGTDKDTQLKKAIDLLS